MDSTPPIVVIGAGVLGLSIATLLQEKERNIPIIIVAAELPPSELDSQKCLSDAMPRPSADYASLWAGAHYRPIPASTPQLADEARLALLTEARMRTIAERHPESSVEFMEGVELLEDVPGEYQQLRSGQQYAGTNDNFRIIPKSDLPKDVKWGCSYKTYTLNAPVYCRWLLRKFQGNGGVVIKKRLQRIDDVFALDLGDNPIHVTPLAVANCSGRNFDTDKSMQIMRGQTVLVEQCYNKTITRQHADGSWTFLIPRPLGAGTIVGGTKEPGDLEDAARPATREEVLRRAAKFFPDFVRDPNDFVVLLDNVGRRPWREGGLRIEREKLERGDVVHAYGAGGRGFELSWGIADAAAKLIHRSIGSVSRL